MKIVVTETAYQDLSDVLDYIALDNPLRAESYTDELLDKIRSLKSMPKRCPVAPESGRRGYELRHLIHDDYRILFTIHKKEIVILRVMHGAKIFS